ncbi:MAG: polysaccharide deacetylase [Selenomonadaceae bacterium]|nr:polysaccharide deacetylase [Selenomonadaceae bacterium]
MFRGSMMLKILCVVVVGGALLAWGITEYRLSAMNAAAKDAGAKETVVAAEEEKAAVPEPAFCVIANDDFSNLQLEDVKKPVYDRYTLAQRREKGLPTELPEIVPYTREKVAYLTFDDGPDNKNTPAILDILKDYGVPATFYVAGTMVEANPDVLKRIYEEGHAIGNHTYDHDYDDLYTSPDHFLAQLMHTDDLIYNIIGVRPLITRAPGGTIGMFTDAFPPALKANGYVEHDWNVCNEDATPKRPNAEMQLSYIDQQTQYELKDNMALVLMHCIGGKEETVNALPGIIMLLQEKGYRFGVVTPMTPQPR